MNASSLLKTRKGDAAEMTGEMNGIMEYILEKASTFGGLLEKFFGIGVLDMPPEEILSSPGAMAVVIGYLTALPVVFLLYAGIRQRKRANQFMVPLYAPEGTDFRVKVTAWKDGKKIEKYPSFGVYSVDGTVLEEIRDRLR